MPICLIGNKTDLRDTSIGYLKSHNLEHTSYTKGLKLAKKVGAVDYMECSSFNLYEVEEIFQKVAKLAISLDNALEMAPLTRMDVKELVSQVNIGIISDHAYVDSILSKLESDDIPFPMETKEFLVSCLKKNLKKTVFQVMT